MMLTSFLFGLWLVLGTAEAFQSDDHDTGQHDNTTTSRDKRYMMKSPYLWPKALVPYIFEESALKDKEEILRVLAYIEDNSCVRFMAWNKDLYKQHGLSHSARVEFYKEEGCSSALGFSEKGVRTNCCEGDICLHGMGHALGLNHEQASKERLGWIDVIDQNIPDVERRFYAVKEDSMYKQTKLYDISTVMHIQQKYYHEDRPSFSKAFPELPIEGKEDFYYFKQLAEGYKCHEMPQCQGRKLVCNNDGYQTIQHGVCRCVCPEGLDPDTLCETPLREVPPNTWPKGQYSFLKPKTGCPFDKAFKEGQLLEFGPDGNYMAEDSKMAGSVSATTINLQFCTRTAEKGEEKEEGSKFNWPFGNFCVFRKGGECPTDFTSKSINYTVNLHATRGESPDLDPGHITLCCQYRGFTRRPAWFPADKPFTLVQHPFEEKCQEVRGMRYDLDLFSITSVDPISTHSDLWIWKSETFNSITIPLCQYTPVYLKCGGTYTMNKDRSSFDLGFTSEGPYAGACTQLFKGDMEKGTMIVDFDRIDLSQSNITTECEDKVEIRHALMGQRGLEYCGKIEHSIRSITDKLMISFITTGGKIPNVKGRIRWVSFDDMCYNVDNRGASYDGNVNYTRAFEPCLPWAEMDNCPHNPYTKVDEIERVDQLTGNACRNPDNSFRPWCYTDKVGCKRNYCDVCGLEKPYDHMPQCDKLKQIGFCKKDSAIAVKHCAATCFDQLTTKPLTKKYTDVYCTEPTIPKDSYMTSALKSRYALGETVWFQCKEGNGLSPTRCMTSGHWSKILSSACKACPKDYVKHGARCLGKTHTTKANYWSAVAKCQTEGGYLASPKSKEESLVINKVSGHLSVWIGINDVQVEGRWEYTEDESELTWTNWGEKEPNNIVNEDCAVMNPNGLKWLDVPCSYSYAFVCSFPTLESKKCVDPLGENRCQNLLEDRPTFCEDLPVFANESCTKTCGICKDKNVMCPVIGDSNPDLKPVVTKNNGPAISVGQSITYTCQDFKYPVGGHGTRACLTSGKLTGEPLQCGDCPFGFILVDDQCLGLIPGKPLTYKEATAECKKLGGFITMPKTKAINDVINIIAGGVKIWIGVNDAAIEGTYDWQDGSVPYWKHWDKSEPKVPGTDYDCALLNEDRRWVNVECDGTMKLSTVCSLPRSDDDICYDMKDGGASYDGMVSHTRTFQSCLPWTEVTNCPHHAYSRGDAHANLVGNACRNPDKSYRPWCYTDAEGCKRNFCDVCGKESPKDKRLDCKQFESDGLCTKEPIRALQDCAATCFNQLPGSTPKKIYPAIKCGTPVPPSDGTVVGSPKPSYNVGETVEYKCKLAEWSVFARCMTSGRWSQTGFTCPACGVGYVQHGDKCYLLFRQHGTYEWAKDHCEKRGGQLAVPSSLAETRYLFTLLCGDDEHAEDGEKHDAKGQGSLMWIGLTDEVKEGNWVTSDGQHPKWTNWYNGSPGQNERENCAYTFPATLKMYDGWCNNKMPFICTTPVLKSGLCEDYRADQCPNLLSQEPKMCTTHPGFASLNCAMTCGLCCSGTGTCDIPKLGPNVMLVKSKHVTTGGYLEFGCSTDTYRTKGDTVRACLPNGEWTGQPLQCGDCPAGYKLVANTCIGLVEGRLQTFDEGREDCRKAGGYVAMPKSVAENDAISKLVHGRYVWIGTTDDANEGHFVWEDGQILTWTNWADGSNNNKNDEKTNCVTLNTQREWVRIQCSSLFPIVCSIPLEGKRCKYAYNGKCYNLIGNSLLHHVMSYDDGMAVCKRDGGKMATPKNADQATFIRKVMDKDGQGSYAWLGINDRIDEGIWKYQDGGSLKWTNWIKNEPNNYGLEGEDCVVMGPNNLWADVSCNARYPVVCEVEQLIPQFVIQCPSPIPPSDAVAVSGENGVYFVGDTVEYKCNKGNSKVYSRCMSNSQWSESGFACMDCPGSSLNGYCYRTFNFTVTYDQATAVCHKIGYSLVAPRTQTEAHFIRTITTGVTVLWIGITDRVTEGQWLYEDGGHVTWTNWSPAEPNNLGTDGEDCAVMIGVLSKWIDVPCDYRYHRGPVCVKKMTIQ